MPPVTATVPPPVAEEKPAAPEFAAAPPKAAAKKPPTVRTPSGPQSLTVISSPKGAVATLDGQPDTACTTPCTLEATPGRHSIELDKAGYGLERREVDVGSTAIEMPAIVMRSVQGTLMLSSEPAGAAVSIDGKRYPHLTPDSDSADPRVVLHPGGMERRQEGQPHRTDQGRNQFREVLDQPVKRASASNS